MKPGMGRAPYRYSGNENVPLPKEQSSRVVPNLSGLLGAPPYGTAATKTDKPFFPVQITTYHPATPGHWPPGCPLLG